MKYCYLLLFAFLLPLSSLAQTEEDDSESYDREFTWGVQKNTHSGLIGGFVFKLGKRINDNQFRTLGLELINIKHPKENRQPADDTGNPYVWQKKNYLYAIRAQYGREIILFRKAPQQGVQISTMLAGGPTLGLLAPYYIKYADSPQPVAFDPEVHREYTRVLGVGSMFQGVPKSKLQIGANLKIALNLELGNFKHNITGFEFGILTEAYTNKVEIMSEFQNNIQNKFFYPTAFLTLYYGRRR